MSHNVRDYSGVEEQFGIRIVRPGSFLKELDSARDAFLEALARVPDVESQEGDELPE